MLTAELVRTRVRDGELRVVPLSDKTRPRALDLAEAFLQLARAHVGRTREELTEALGLVECAPADRLVAEGLRKLIEDRCVFDVPEDVSPEELRSEVFLRTAALRRGDPPPDREAVLGEVAAARGLLVAEVERRLYADLRGAHVLTEVAPLGAAELVGGYDMAQAQAVLLRAVRVTAEVRCASPGAYRALFRKLKFLRLLYAIYPLSGPLPGGAGYRLEIDGPFSLFESVTKYGLQLALALPLIAACDHYRLAAEVRWGKARQALRFSLEGDGDGDGGREGEPLLADEVAALLRGFQAQEGPWQARVSTAVLHLPGAGLCVPDLLFQHRDTRKKVYLEVMGFWSRDAVWRRVELVQQGLPDPVLFAVSERLRVSEQVLGDDLPAALYVYKGTLSARIVAERLDRLSAR